MPPPLLSKAYVLLILGMLTAVTAVCRTARADGPSWEPAPTTGPIITDTAVPIPRGELAVQPFWSLGFVRGNFSARGRRESAGGNFVSLEMPVKFTYGPAPNVEVYVMASFLQNWAGGVREPDLPGTRDASFSGLGDVYLIFKYQLLEETPRRPTVTALFGVDFPTGHHFRLNPGRLGTDSLGSGTYVFTPGINLSKWLGPVCLYANLWYSIPNRDSGAAAHQQAGPLLYIINGRDLITWNLAAEWPLTPRWVALLEFYSTWGVGPIFRPSREPFSTLLGMLPGVECILSEHVSAALGVAVDLAGKNSFFAYTPVFTLLLKF
jgi:hypothetical protein